MTINKEKLDEALGLEVLNNFKGPMWNPIIEAAREYSRIKQSLDRMIEAYKENMKSDRIEDDFTLFAILANEISKITEGQDE